MIYTSVRKKLIFVRVYLKGTHGSTCPFDSGHELKPGRFIRKLHSIALPVQVHLGFLQ